MVGDGPITRYESQILPIVHSYLTLTAWYWTITTYIVSNAAKGRMTWCIFTPRDTIVSSHPLCSEASSPSTALWCVPGRGLVCCSGLRIYDSILPSIHCRPRITFYFGLLLHVLVVSPEAGKRLQCSGQDPVMQLNPERDA